MANISSVLFTVLCSAIFLECLASPTLRIIGGDEAKSDELLFVVSVRRNNAHFCGGSLIKKNMVLTAGHCVSEEGTTPVQPSAITVRVGSKNQFAGGKLIQASKIHIHNLYGNFLNDVAIIELVSDAVLGPKVQIIDIADASDAVSPGNSVAIAGWGRTVSDGANVYKLHQSTASVISAADCQEKIGYGLAEVVCVENKPGAGACNGDAGGPAVFNNKLVGVSNFVIGTCGTKYPDVYARVSHFANWIKSITDPK